MNTVNPGYMQDMTPDEVAALTGDTPAETAAEQAAPVNDEALEGAATDVEDGQNAPQVESDSTSQETDPVSEAAAADALAELDAGKAANPEPQEAPKAFAVPGDDFQAARKELRDQKRSVHEKWTSGELTDAEYFEQTDALDDQIASVVAAHAQKVTLAEINAQNEARVRQAHEAAETQAMAQVAAASKAANQIDYSTDAVACGQFDASFNAVKLDPANARLSPAEVASKAHGAVLALRGIAPAPQPVRQAKAMQQASEKPDIPPALADMPSAAAQPIGADPLDDIMNIEDPDVREARWAALTVAQRQQALRATVPVARRKH